MGDFASMDVDPRFSTKTDRKVNDESLMKQLNDIFNQFPAEALPRKLAVTRLSANGSVTLHDSCDDIAIRDEGLVVTRLPY